MPRPQRRLHFDEAGRLRSELAALAPKGKRRMGGNPHANGGLLLKELKLPAFQKFAVEVAAPGRSGIATGACEVIDRVPSLASRAGYAKQAIRNALIDHRQYINKYGEDDPRILNWRWDGQASTTSRRSSTEGDNL